MIPSINWGRGRLRPFESYYSFASKFCKLNAITPKQFRDFLSRECGIDAALQGLNKNSFHRLSKILDEPCVIVKTLFTEHYALPWRFGNIAVTQRNDHQQDRLLYCPICAQAGYHAFFHQHPWLAKCLLHREPLKNAPNLRFWHANCYFDSLVKRLDNTLSELDMDWVAQSFKSPQEDNQKIRKGLAGYLHWLSFLKSQTSFLESTRPQWDIWDTTYFSDYHVLFSRLNWLKSAPASVKSCLAFDVLELTPKIIQLQENCFDHLTHPNREFSLEDIIWFYGITSLLTGNADDSIIAIQNYTNLLSTHHRHCDCQWLMDTSTDNWTHHSNRIIWGYGLQCPFELAENYLKEKWICPLANEISRSNRHNNALYYIYMADRLIADGLAKALSPTPCIPIFNPIWTGQPYVEWAANQKLTTALKKIIECEVQKDISGISRWLNRFNPGQKPQEMKKFLGEVAVYNGRDPFILIWPSPMAD